MADVLKKEIINVLQKLNVDVGCFHTPMGHAVSRRTRRVSASAQTVATEDCGTVEPLAIGNLLADSTISMPSEHYVPARSVIDPDTLRELHARLAELNLGISTAQGPLTRPNRLVEERIILRRVLDSVAVYYPILTLPPEIIEEIFVACLPADDNPTPNPCTAPLLLLQICSRWREIALSAGRLWTSMRINLVSETVEKRISLLETWLRRTGSRPLSLALVYKNYEENPSPVRLIDCLATSSERWRDVRLELPLKDLERLHRLEGSVPNLRKLLIGPTDAYYSGMRDIRPSPIRAFSISPALREVHLVTGFPFTIELPWAQLTKLQATSLNVHECLEILAASPALVDCSLSLRQSFETGDLAPIAPLENLEVLTLRNSGFHVELLERLTLPALRELQFHISVVAAEPQNLLKIIAFLERSDTRSQLQRIYFSGMIDLSGNQVIKDLLQRGAYVGPPLDTILANGR